MSSGAFSFWLTDEYNNAPSADTLSTDLSFTSGTIEG